MLLLALIVLVPSSLFAADEQPARPDFAPLGESIRTRLVQQQVPSLAVAVAREGQVLWEEGFGWADRERRVPATQHTLYSLASISKPMTATGLMILVQRGQVDLDRPVNDYLGDAKLRSWVGDARSATVRQVANHTAGLPLHYHFFYADEPYRRPPMAETIRRYGHLVRPPGEKFVYSNLGYGILDHVITRVSGRSYADFLRREIFLPLGMTRASVDIGPGLEPFAAVRYGADALPLPFYDFDHPGGSAVFCSAHDLLRFGLFHLKAHLPDQKAILPDQQIDHMQQPGKDSADAGYGVGWSLRETRGYREVSHAGGMGGVSTTLTLIPSEKIAVVALCNASHPLPQRIKDEILAVLLPDAGQKTSPKLPARPENRPEQEKAAQPLPFTGEWRGNVHTYQGERPLVLWFKESGDVHARLGDQLKALVNDVRFQGDEMSGVMVGDLGSADAKHPYHLHLDLQRRGQTLTGAVVAISRPGRRPGNALAHPVELRKHP